MAQHKWHKEIKNLSDRITNYLGNGGFFNPELMEHLKVRDLLMDCRDFFNEQIKPHRHKREIYWNKTEEKYCSRRICGCGKYDEIIPNQTTIDAINEAIQSFEGEQTSNDEETEYRIKPQSKECKECEALKQDIDTFRKITQDLINKEWQGLTDWEIIDCIDVDCPPDKAICGSTKGIMKLAKAIEQKLKEKNYEQKT